MLTWLIRPRSIPVEFWYVLSDAASAKRARRRVACWLWLPAILAAVTVGVAHFVTVDFDARVWYYEQSDPQKRPLRDVMETDNTDRLFAFNLHLFRGGFFFSKPASWVEVVEPKRRSLGFSVPAGIEPLPFFWGCVPLGAVVFGYLPPRLLFLARERHRASGRERHNVDRAAGTAWIVMSAPLGIALWIWLLAILACVPWQLGGSEEWYFSVIAGLTMAATAWWALASLVGYGILARKDHARLIVTNRLGFWMVCVVLSLGGPTGVVYAIMRLCK